MVEFSFEEAKELLEKNLQNAKSNLQSYVNLIKLNILRKMI